MAPVMTQLAIGFLTIGQQRHVPRPGAMPAGAESHPLAAEIETRTANPNNATRVLNCDKCELSRNHATINTRMYMFGSSIVHANEDVHVDLEVAFQRFSLSCAFIVGFHELTLFPPLLCQTCGPWVASHAASRSTHPGGARGGPRIQPLPPRWRPGILAGGPAD